VRTVRTKGTAAARGIAVLAGLLALVAVAAVVGSRASARRPPPDVVVVLIDALRRDHVGRYGYHLPTTPFLDALARRGVTFDDAWSHAPQTFNATASLLVGGLFPPLLTRPVASPDASGATSSGRALAPQNETLAEVLSASGYDTLAVFTNPHHDDGSGFAQGFRLWRYLEPATPGRAYATAAEVARTFDALAAELDPERPFFAYVHYMDVHNPYTPPPELAAEFVRTSGVDRYMNGRPEGDEVPSDDDLRFMIESYDACIRHADDSVRALLAAIESLARGRDTILVVTADHGDEFMDHGGLGHGHSMYQELLRVPLIVAGGELPADVRVPGLARGIDVPATIVALAGVATPASFEGRSLLPRIAAAAAGDLPDATGPEIERVRVRLDAPENELSFAWNAHLRGLTSERLHLAADVNLRAFELYDVQNDPRGQEDLSRTLARSTRRMRRLLEDYERRLVDSEIHARALERAGSVAPAVDARTADQLRALGYAE